MQRALEDRDRAVEKLHKEELVRRKLHNQLQELKGNIRVFCRLRPALPAEHGTLAKISFPDEEAEGQQILVSGPAPGGSGSPRLHPFGFDKVFSPSASNGDIFEEISQLVQSALDGYNVCIFAYGQTGSGKTYTMSSTDGMIPRAVEQVFSTAASVRERGWRHELSGEFLEIYNENINDLLGRPDEYDRPRHEIRHDTKLRKTTVTGLTSVSLDSPEMVADVLARANKNRSVAATNANERSSRSHSVFTLRIRGVNAATGNETNGTLNLIDLAGSERLAHSGATGERLRETQAINKSLSCLGDVIHALSNAKEGTHIPYRNSKLTYLLQFALSGDSKTLMFVNISPLESHVGETVSSLRFAQKTNNTKLKNN
jgi:kinesin family protein C1